MISGGLPVGTLVYLKLEGFIPAWRQALVIFAKDRSKRLLFAVRVLEAELETEWQNLTFFQLKGSKFILVEGDINRVRPQCTQVHRALEVDPDELLEKAKEAMQKDDAQFATASEELIAEDATTKKSRKSLFEKDDSSSSEESGDSEEDDVLVKMLRQAQRKIPDGAMPSDAPGKQSRSRSSRYPLLEQQERKFTPSSPLDALLKQNMSKPLDPGTLSALVQMELLKELRNKGKRKEHRDKDPDHSQDSSSSDSSVVGDLKPRGAGKALQAYRQTKKEMKRRPEKHIKRYIRDAEEVLGVTKGIPYRLTDFTQKLNWGKQRTLHRVHYALSSILELQLQGKTMQSTLLMTQVLRSINQCSLDQGDWRTAWLLTHLPDPMLRPRFGGEEQSLEVIGAYVKAMHDLEKRGRSSAADQDVDDPVAGKGKNGKGKKGKKAEGDPES